MLTLSKNDIVHLAYSVARFFWHELLNEQGLVDVCWLKLSLSDNKLDDYKMTINDETVNYFSTVHQLAKILESDALLTFKLALEIGLLFPTFPIKGGKK